MTTQVDHTIPRTVELPGPSDDAAWTAELVARIAAGVRAALDTPISRDELLTTYGTADPAVLRACFALPDDVAAAERYATENRRVAA